MAKGNWPGRHRDRAAVVMTGAIHDARWQRWTDAEIELLRSDRPAREIAALTDRTLYAVENKRRKIRKEA